ncbi:MAG: TilS substrate-binding domain-containing protein [Thiolinea sp.]
MERKALLRHWLQQQGFILPSARKLAHVLQDVLQARPDAQPCALGRL